MDPELANTNQTAAAAASRAPKFLARLGLAVPASLEDIEQAYRDKVMVLHPDHGGSAEAFKELEEAYQQALEYGRFRSGRRRWLGAQVDRFVEQEALLVHLRERGGQAELQRIDWMIESVGADFAQILDQIVGLRLAGAAFDDDTIDYLADRRELLTTLHTLDLSESGLTDRGLARLMAFAALRHLDVRSTRITGEGLQVLGSLPSLRTLDARGVNFGWLGGWKLRHAYPDVNIIT